MSLAVTCYIGAVGLLFCKLFVVDSVQGYGTNSLCSFKITLLNVEARSREALHICCGCGQPGLAPDGGHGGGLLLVLGLEHDVGGRDGGFKVVFEVHGGHVKSDLLGQHISP